jgi:hypothetical protein
MLGNSSSGGFGLGQNVIKAAAPSRETDAEINDLVMIVEVQFQNGEPQIMRVLTVPGLYREAGRGARPEFVPMADMPSLVMLFDEGGRQLFEKEFHAPRFLTVPMGEQASLDIIELRNPTVAIVLPYFEDASRAVVDNQGRRTSVDIKLMEETRLFAQIPRFQRSTANADKLHVLILSNGYSAGGLSSFYAAADAIKSFLLSLEPFSGSTAIEVNAYPNMADLGCYHNCGGTDRLICCNGTSVVAAAASSGFLYDEIIVVHNSTVYGGGGYTDGGNYRTNSYTSFAVTYGGDASSRSTVKAVAVHEFGHSFGNLCDEYSYGGTPGNPVCVNCRPTCGDWSAWDSGCLQSCSSRTDYYRPTNSIMNVLSAGVFNQASIKADFFPDGLAKRLAFFTGITLLAPENFTVQRIENNLLLAKEYINRLSWRPNSGNLVDTSSYKLFAKPKDADDGQYSLVTTLNGSATSADHRYLKKNEFFTYKLVAVDASGKESPPAFCGN